MPVYKYEKYRKKDNKEIVLKISGITEGLIDREVIIQDWSIAEEE